MKKNNEIKRDRKSQFVKLANSRVNKTLNHIRLIGNLSETSNYVYTQEQVDKIHSALVNALDKMKIRFDQGGEVDTGFYLDKELAND